VPAAEPKTRQSGGGIFAHLKPKRAHAATVQVPMEAITWARFQRVILPAAQAIEILVPENGNFLAFVTAVNPEATPILQ
ncbi:MAG: hypothetical protein V4710_24580, partial [Verrucomicrobiota bacterium]